MMEIPLVTTDAPAGSNFASSAPPVMIKHVSIPHILYQDYLNNNKDLMTVPVYQKIADLPFYMHVSTQSAAEVLSRAAGDGIFLLRWSNSKERLLLSIKRGSEMIEMPLCKNYYFDPLTDEEIPLDRLETEKLTVITEQDKYSRFQVPIYTFLNGLIEQGVVSSPLYLRKI
jgi:hypothetical protein